MDRAWSLSGCGGERYDGSRNEGVLRSCGGGEEGVHDVSCRVLDVTSYIEAKVSHILAATISPSLTE